MIRDLGSCTMLLIALMVRRRNKKEEDKNKTNKTPSTSKEIRYKLRDARMEYQNKNVKLIWFW